MKEKLKNRYFFNVYIALACSLFAFLSSISLCRFRKRRRQEQTLWSILPAFKKEKNRFSDSIFWVDRGNSIGLKTKYYWPIFTTPFITKLCVKNIFLLDVGSNKEMFCFLNYFASTYKQQIWVQKPKFSLFFMFIPLKFNHTLVCLFLPPQHS